MIVYSSNNEFNGLNVAAFSLVQNDKHQHGNPSIVDFKDDRKAGITPPFSHCKMQALAVVENYQNDEDK